MSEGRLFEPDVLITDQFVTARRRRSALSSEKRLMLAVLENALDDYQKYVHAIHATASVNSARPIRSSASTYFW